MIELRTLGTLELAGLEPRSTGALMAQPKRLAVLAYLAVASDGGGRARPAVIPMFWPESDRERGQGSLRNAVHFLRRHLGSDTIRSHGDRLVVGSSLRCDAAVFEEHLEQARPEEALRLYGGDLLPGLSIEGCPGFTRWLEKERERLRGRAAEAAWELAEQAEARGHWISATDHARRAALLSGGGERALRRLMLLLDRAGDRVAAFREYESFAARWKREYGLAPSPETEALAGSLRSGSVLTDGSTGGPGRRYPRGTSSTLAVLPFSLTGREPGDKEIAGGLAHEIIASLARTSNVHVIARGSVDRYRSREGRTLRRIAGELGADTVLDGSLRVVDGRIVVAVRLVEARTETPVWGEVYEGDPDEVLEIRTDLVLDLLDALRIGVSPEEADHLSSAPTAHPEAYRLYLEGRSLWNRRARSDIEAAAGRFERALELDPEFALARAGLADAYLVLYPAGGVQAREARILAVDAARAALSLDPRLGEAHATLAVVRAAVELDWEGAEQDFRRAVELSPGHATARHWYGAALTFIACRPEAGADELEVARQLDPLSPIIHDDIGLNLLHRDRRQEALLKFREALELDPGFWRAHQSLGVASILCGDPRDGVSHLERAWRMVGQEASAAGGVGLEPPAPDGWRRRLERMLGQLEAGRGRRGNRPFRGALLCMLLGRHDEAVHWLDGAAEEGWFGTVLQYYPVFAPLRAHPAFAAMLQDLEWERVPRE